MDNCINSTRELVCRIYHPICLHKPADNGYKYFRRGVCKESCDSFYDGCQKTLQFLWRAYGIHNHCPQLNLARDLGEFPKCQEFSLKDIQKIEKCFLLEKAGKSFDLT